MSIVPYLDPEGYSRGNQTKGHLELGSALYANYSELLSLSMRSSYKKYQRKQLRQNVNAPAQMAAPNPLSILTTLTPGEHELSIVKSGARPAKAAP